MTYSVVQTVAPSSEPVTLAEVKLQCRIDSDMTAEDTLLTQYIAIARQQIENETGRQLITATWVYRADAFPVCRWIEMPRPPLLTITTLAYVDGAGTTQTWASSNYRVNSYADPGRLELAYGVSWPTVRSQFDAVQVSYTAGYGAAASAVPEPLRQAILLWVADLYLRREPTGDRQAYLMPLSVERLLWPYRVASVLIG